MTQLEELNSLIKDAQEQRDGVAGALRYHDHCLYALRLERVLLVSPFKVGERVQIRRLKQDEHLSYLAHNPHYARLYELTDIRPGEGDAIEYYGRRIREADWPPKTEVRLWVSPNWKMEKVS